MEIRRQLGLNVQRFRREKGWSQEKLAFESELHRTYLSGIERGVRNPTITIVSRLAAALGTTAGSLLDAPPKGRRS